MPTLPVCSRRPASAWAWKPWPWRPMCSRSLHIPSPLLPPQMCPPSPPTISTADNRLCYLLVLLNTAQWLPCSSDQEIKKEKHLYTQEVRGLALHSLPHFPQPPWACLALALHNRLTGITSARPPGTCIPLISTSPTGSLLSQETLFPISPKKHLSWGTTSFHILLSTFSSKDLCLQLSLVPDSERASPLCHVHLDTTPTPFPGPQPCEAQ